MKTYNTGKIEAIFSISFCENFVSSYQKKHVSSHPFVQLLFYFKILWYRNENAYWMIIAF